MADIPLIARKTLFGNPDRASVQISPDGAHIAYLAPLDGVLNVWVAPRDALDTAEAVTHDTGRGVRTYLWAYTNTHILFIRDKNGDENWRLHRVDITSRVVADLTPFDGVQAQLVGASPRFADEIVVGLNERDRRWHDIYRLNLVTGAMTLMLQNDRFARLMVDDDYRMRLAASMGGDGSIGIYGLGDDGDWVLWQYVPFEDTLTTSPLGFDRTGSVVYMEDSRGRDTSALKAHNLDTGEAVLLAEDPRCDVHGVLRHPTEKHVQAVSFVYERKAWQVLDRAIEEDLEVLRRVADGDVEVVSRTLDDRFWIVLYVLDNGPARFYLYDHRERSARFLFADRQALEKQPLVKMRPVVIRSRDGLDLVAYYTLPAGSDSDGDGIPDQPVPMVFTPHGGPWGRDVWGYNPWHQWLANRGYGVLCVNFRSSTGLGKAFVNAGDRQWAGKIHEDQIDAVKWAIEAGIADAGRVAVLGASFGGYSALAGLAFSPEVFACAVDIVGPANLITLLESMPAYWRPMFEMFAKRVGDPRTEEGRALLREHSPLTFAERMCRPLLIGQGANDPRVKQAESDQIVQALQGRRIAVTYVLYPDEGHGFARPQNRMSFYAIAEAFLARWLGGRHEAIGKDFQGSSLQVLVGAEQVPGLRGELDELS